MGNCTGKKSKENKRQRKQEVYRACQSNNVQDTQSGIAACSNEQDTQDYEDNVSIKHGASYMSSFVGNNSEIQEQEDMPSEQNSLQHEIKHAAVIKSEFQDTLPDGTATDVDIKEGTTYELNTKAKELYLDGLSDNSTTTHAKARPDFPENTGKSHQFGQGTQDDTENCEPVNKSGKKKSPKKKKDEGAKTQDLPESVTKSGKTESAHKNAAESIKPTVHSFEKIHVLTEVSKSVGFIRGPILTGTCWRVGNDKIITTAHIVLENTWNFVFEYRDESKLDKLFVDFDYISNESPISFKIERKVLFSDEQLNIAVLQLKRDGRKQFPPPLKTFYRLNPNIDEDKHIYLIGHNLGSKKVINFGIGLWNPTEKKMQDLEKFDEKYGKPNGYLQLDRKDRLVIQCDFVKGSSGSPGIVFIDNVAHVVLVYLRGFPSFYYDKHFSQEQKRNFPRDKLFQQGVNIGNLFDTMSKRPFLHLCNEIFPLEEQLELNDMPHHLAMTVDKTPSNNDKTKSSIDSEKDGVNDNSQIVIGESCSASTVQDTDRLNYAIKQTAQDNKNDGSEKCTVQVITTKPTTIHSVETMTILKEVSKSVGHILGPKTSGTCWRVGNDKIITAAHVVKGNIWNTDLKFLHEEELTHLNVDFDYISEKSSFFFKVEPRILFFDESLDVAVLQLKQDVQKQYPPPLMMFYRLNTKKDEDKQIYLISHNKSEKKEVNSGIGLWEPTQKKLQDLEKFCEKYDKQNEYIELDRADRLVVKCDFESGASGSPGIVMFNNVAYVVFVYIMGFPGFYYNQLSEEDKRTFPRDKLLQQGVNIGNIFDNMSRNSEDLKLRDEIFPLEANIMQQQRIVTRSGASHQLNKAESSTDSVEHKMDDKKSDSEMKLKNSKGTECTVQNEQRQLDVSMSNRHMTHCSDPDENCIRCPEDDTNIQNPIVDKTNKVIITGDEDDCNIQKVQANLMQPQLAVISSRKSHQIDSTESSTDRFIHGMDKFISNYETAMKNSKGTECTVQAEQRQLDISSSNRQMTHGSVPEDKCIDTYIHNPIDDKIINSDEEHSSVTDQSVADSPEDCRSEEHCCIENGANLMQPQLAVISSRKSHQIDSTESSTDRFMLEMDKFISKYETAMKNSKGTECTVQAEQRQLDISSSNRQMTHCSVPEDECIDTDKEDSAMEKRMKIFREVSKSVGYIYGPRESGTCWRVGSDKIITAAHVVKDNIWNTILNMSIEEDLHKLNVEFGNSNKKSQNVFKVESRILFIDECLDIVVLQLKPDDHKQFPPELRMFHMLNPQKHKNERIYLICHNKWYFRSSEDGFWNPTTERLQRLETFCEKYGKENGYPELDRKDRLVIQCGFVGGASGSPGIVIFDNVPFVVFVHLRGFPTFYYSTQFSYQEQELFPGDKLLQQGVNIGNLFDNMSNYETHLKLRNEIFLVEANLEQIYQQHRLAITCDDKSYNTAEKECSFDSETYRKSFNIA